MHKREPHYTAASSNLSLQRCSLYLCSESCVVVLHNASHTVALLHTVPLMLNTWKASAVVVIASSSSERQQYCNAVLRRQWSSKASVVLHGNNGQCECEQSFQARYYVLSVPSMLVYIECTVIGKVVRSFTIARMRLASNSALYSTCEQFGAAPVLSAC
jgi:hypothetical protein